MPSNRDGCRVRVRIHGLALQAAVDRSMPSHHPRRQSASATPLPKTALNTQADARQPLTTGPSADAKQQFILNATRKKSYRRVSPRAGIA